MKLYYFPGACSLASHIVAAEGGLKLSLEKVNLKDHKTESGHDFFGINPKGYVPALALENGELLTENVALLMYIGDKAGLTHEGLERYRLLEWLAFISTEIHKSFSPLFRNPSPEVAQAAREKILNRLSFINKRLNMRGFSVRDHAAEIHDYIEEASGWLRDGKLKYQETIVTGIENAPAAFARLFSGENFGKLVIDVA